jgi:hypothetical protein
VEAAEQRAGRLRLLEPAGWVSLRRDGAPDDWPPLLLLIKPANHQVTPHTHATERGWPAGQPELLQTAPPAAKAGGAPEPAAVSAAVPAVPAEAVMLEPCRGVERPPPLQLEYNSPPAMAGAVEELLIEARGQLLAERRAREVAEGRAREASRSAFAAAQGARAAMQRGVGEGVIGTVQLAPAVLAQLAALPVPPAFLAPAGTPPPPRPGSGVERLREFAAEGLQLQPGAVAARLQIAAGEGKTLSAVAAVGAVEAAVNHGLAVLLAGAAVEPGAGAGARALALAAAGLAGEAGAPAVTSKAGLAAMLLGATTLDAARCSIHPMHRANECRVHPMHRASECRSLIFGPAAGPRAPQSSRACCGQPRG